MEFLDDLRKNQNTEDRTEQTRTSESNSWDTLLSSVAFEDPYEENKTAPKKELGRSSRSRKTPKRGKIGRGNKARRQKRVLTLLAISVFIVSGIIFAVILRMSDNNAAWWKPSSPLVATEPDTTLVPSQSGDSSMTEPLPAETSSTTEENGGEPEPPPQPPVVLDAPFTRFDREIQENPKLIDLYQLRGQEYIAKGAYEAALADFQYVLAIDDSRAEAHAGIGIVAYHMRRWNEAEKSLQAAIDINDELSEAYFWLGHIYFNKGEYKAAFYAYDMAAEYDRSNATAEAWLAVTSAQLGDYYETLGAVTRAMSITHDLAIVYVASSWEHLLQDPPDIDGAQGDLLYARELEPNDFVTLNALARFYLNYRPERLAEAELLAHYAQNWASDDIQRAIALQTLGRIYLAKGLNSDAERVFIQAMDLATVDGYVSIPGLADDFSRSRE
jgi:tetratricopeptide (TPR) repeat protein